MLGKRAFFQCIYPSIYESYPDEIVSAATDQIVDFCMECSKGIFGKTPTKSGSLNNSKGEWFELLFLDQSLIELTNPCYSDYDMFKIPSAIEGHKYWDLFPEPVCRRIESLNLHLSNPDFILTKLPDSLKSKKYTPAKGRMKSLLDRYEDTSFFGEMDPSKIVCNFSVKTHTRPDRRYQHLHEGNVLKAIASRVGSPLPYVVVTTETKEKDEVIFKSSSIASITGNDQKPTPAIDQVVRVKKFSDIRRVISDITSVHMQKFHSD